MDPVNGLGFVWCEGSRLIGSIRFWPVHLVSPAGASPETGILLGPLAVHPDFRGRGIAPDLVAAGLGAAEAQGILRVFAVGDLPYLGRFGFVPATTLGLSTPIPIPGHRFLVHAPEGATQSGTPSAVVPVG